MHKLAAVLDEVLACDADTTYLADVTAEATRQQQQQQQQPPVIPPEDVGRCHGESSQTGYTMPSGHLPAAGPIGLLSSNIEVDDNMEDDEDIQPGDLLPLSSTSRTDRLAFFPEHAHSLLQQYGLSSTLSLRERLNPMKLPGKRRVEKRPGRDVHRKSVKKPEKTKLHHDESTDKPRVSEAVVEQGASTSGEIIQQPPSTIPADSSHLDQSRRDSALAATLEADDSEAEDSNVSLMAFTKSMSNNVANRGPNATSSRTNYRSYPKMTQDGIPSISCRGNEIRPRVVRSIMVRVKYKCEQCETVFVESTICRTCGHRRCSNCIRSPPRSSEGRSHRSASPPPVH